MTWWYRCRSWHTIWCTEALTSTLSSFPITLVNQLHFTQGINTPKWTFARFVLRAGYFDKVSENNKKITKQTQKMRFSICVNITIASFTRSLKKCVYHFYFHTLSIYIQTYNIYVCSCVVLCKQIMTSPREYNNKNIYLISCSLCVRCCTSFSLNSEYYYNVWFGLSLVFTGTGMWNFLSHNEWFSYDLHCLKT